MLKREAHGQGRRGSLKIGDMSEDEALGYLTLRKVDGKLATQIYEPVGGRMVLLKYTVNNIEGWAQT